jgi:sugar O-acyltransferase (sialic acid O-acetyltransferase NeuD family)
VSKKLILIGGGGHCKSCIDVIEQSDEYEIAGIIDKQEYVGQTVLGYEIIGTDEQIESLAGKGYDFLITVGQIRTPQIRQNIYNELIMRNASLATVISPRAYVSKHAVIEDGTIIMHDALVNADVHIGKNCIINSKSLLEHDVVIEDHCHISTAAVLNGGVVVKEGTFFGSNSVCKENVKTKIHDFIKANSLYLGAYAKK